MMNLLSGDIYKLYRRKSPYVFLLVFLGLALLGAVMIYIGNQYLTEPIDASVDVQLPSILFPPLSNLFIAIFSALYISSEFSYGTMKNIASRGYSRMAVYLSKYICVCLFSLVMLVGSVLINSVIYGIFLGFGTYTSDMVTDSILLFFLSLLIQFAVCAVYTFFSFLLANVGSALAINIVINTLMGMILSLVDLGLYMAKSDVVVSRYWINSMSSYLTTYSPANKDVRITIIATLLYIAVFLAGGIAIFSNRDIKA